MMRNLTVILRDSNLGAKRPPQIVKRSLSRGRVVRYFCPRFARFDLATSSVMFVTGIMRLFRSNCPLKGQNRISLEAAKLYRKSKACSLLTAWERLLERFFIAGSLLLLLSSKLPLFHLSPLCCLSTKCIFFFISRNAVGREASNK